MRIGFTGSRDGMTEQQKQTLIQVLQENVPVEFHHGDCVGADSLGLSKGPWLLKATTYMIADRLSELLK